MGLESEGVTREKVEEFIEKVRTDAREDRLNLPKGRKTSLTFREAAEQYLERQAQEGGKDLAAKRRRLEQHVVPHFSPFPLAGITTSHVDRYKKLRRDKGAASGAINRELTVISHLFSKAVEWKWIDYRPAKINRFKEENARITYLTEEQIGRLLASAQEDDNPQVYPFIVTGLETSMRKGEILSIRLEHIDLTKQTIFIPKAKAGAREQPMTRFLAEFLEPYVTLAEPGEEWLFPSSASATGYTVNIDKAFRRVVTRAGLDPREVVRHTLRHTAITHLVQLGIDLPTVQRISGHRTLQMVVRYAHQNGEHIKTALDKLDQRYRPRAGASSPSKKPKDPASTLEAAERTSEKE